MVLVTLSVSRDRRRRYRKWPCNSVVVGGRTRLGLMSRTARAIIDHCLRKRSDQDVVAMYPLMDTSSENRDLMGTSPDNRHRLNTPSEDEAAQEYWAQADAEVCEVCGVTPEDLKALSGAVGRVIDIANSMIGGRHDMLGGPLATPASRAHHASIISAAPPASRPQRRRRRYASSSATSNTESDSSPAQPGSHQKNDASHQKKHVSHKKKPVSHHKKVTKVTKGKFASKVAQAAMEESVLGYALVKDLEDHKRAWFKEKKNVEAKADAFFESLDNRQRQLLYQGYAMEDSLDERLKKAMEDRINALDDHQRTQLYEALHPNAKTKAIAKSQSSAKRKDHSHEDKDRAPTKKRRTPFSVHQALADRQLGGRCLATQKKSTASILPQLR